MMIKEKRGVTLIELMVALVISAVLVAGTYTIFVSQQRTYVLQDQVVVAQQDGRAALLMMSKDIRMAGMLTGVNGFSVYGATDAINPVNNTTVPDQITVVYAAEEFTSGGASVYVPTGGVSGQQVTLIQPIGDFFNDGSGTTKRQYVAFEGQNSVYQIASGGVSGSTLTLTTSPPDNLGTFKARVFRVRAITYSVSGNTLQRNNGEGAQPLAGATNQSQVEDLQIAYQLAGSNTWIYDNNPAHTWPAGSTNADIRAVRITLSMRTPIEDTADKNYSREGQEDHTGSATKDGYRRRVYTTVVKLRNF